MVNPRDWRGQGVVGSGIWKWGELEAKLSNTKSTFKGRKYYEYFGKDRRLCKIEANAIIYSSWETFMLQTIFISFSNLRKIFFGLGTKEW